MLSLFKWLDSPPWPFGASTARVKVIENIGLKKSVIKEFNATVHDDGSPLQESNCHVKWGDSEITITLTSSDQADDVYVISLLD